MKQLIVHNIGFRSVAPLCTGTIIYLLVLMFFDSLNQLSSNFFGGELLLTIGITYVVFFILRMLILLMHNLFPLEQLPKTRISVQFIAGVFIAGILTWVIIMLYFKYVLGFSQYNREASIFISLFVLISIIYNTLYFSIYYLNIQNEGAIEKEEQVKNLLINDFNGLLRDTRPELFTLGMEALLVQLRKNKSKADKYISTFCNVYRYNLHNRKSELIDLRDELNNLDNLLEVLNSKFENNISLTNKVSKEQYGAKLLPTTLQVLTETSVFSCIVNNESPMHIEIKTDSNGNLIFRHSGLIGLKDNHMQQDIQYLSNSQKYFTGKAIGVEKNISGIEYVIPLITNEIDALE
jgi:hypothetical protein